ncbi:hypothetical protein GGQ97_000104 [Sphingomonas kaistensis]|uniref:2OG-Fe(II) oxygenase n=1 Tax=Sphingomonas kaistensis TaxID=298708 RepID=A0A7X6BFR6_9SPHN|nr:hypothetical protein [Sphingomonas kaistensis]NJC04311.1 hypothetical protein [Sphingomonas kaistensis]
MKHFLDREWLAPNVMRVAIDPAIPAGFVDLAADPVPPSYHVERPAWSSDIRWISSADEASFARFQAAFDALDVARHVADYVAVDRAIRLYQGFVVARSLCREPDFHVDWDATGNQAFTLITPIGSPKPGFGLLFKTLTGETRSYDYREGEAVIFGDQFLHSTQPGQSEDPTALLSFTFGTDRMEDWPAIRKTAGFQGGRVRRPDGVLE